MSIALRATFDIVNRRKKTDRGDADNIDCRPSTKCVFFFITLNKHANFVSNITLRECMT